MNCMATAHVVVHVAASQDAHFGSVKYRRYGCAGVLAVHVPCRSVQHQAHTRSGLRKGHGPEALPCARSGLLAAGTRGGEVLIWRTREDSGNTGCSLHLACRLVRCPPC